MIIKKILNNNVIITENKSGREMVAMGRGIAFNKKTGDFVADAEVQKTYLLSNPNMMENFKLLLESLSPDYLQVADEIITLAEKTLGCKLNESIYIALTDHIHMAVRRIRDGIIIRNMVLQETHKFYEKEFLVGQMALEIMNKRFNVSMPEDEIGFIALHLINAQMDQPVANQMMQLIQEIINVVRLSCRTEFDKDSLSYYRFVTHLKFFAKRVLVGRQSADEIEDEIYSVIKKKYSKATACADKIAALIEKKYQYKVSSDEKFYLTIHIAKVISE